LKRTKMKRRKRSGRAHYNKRRPREKEMKDKKRMKERPLTTETKTAVKWGGIQRTHASTKGS